MGAELVTGGEKISAALYKPTVLLNPPTDVSLSKNEVFGPIVSVFSCKNMEEAINMANDVPFSFQASVMTQDIDKAMYAYRRQIKPEKAFFKSFFEIQKTILAY